jgi:SH3 domain-containing YSC84-like protein 1
MLKVVTSAAFFALFTCTAWAQGNASTTSAQNENSGPKSEELNKAAQTVQDLTSSNQIPQQLLSQAKCIGVIPSMTKGGFIAGGEHGSGVVSCRTANAWSAPAFFSISGGSFGLQAGLEKSEIVLLMNDQGRQYMTQSNFQLGAEAVAAGPTSGASGAVGWKAPVLSYAKSKGAYAGVNLAGSTIHLDNDAIHHVYGSNATADQVLNGSVQPPAQAQQFISALQTATR